MFYPNKKEYHVATAVMIVVVFTAGVIGYAVGHGIMQSQCLDIMGSNIPVPSPIYAFKG